DVNNLVAFTAKPLDGNADGKSKTIEERINDGFWLLLPIMLLALFGFRKGVVLAALIVVMPINPASAAAFKTDDQQAYEQFESGNYQDAASAFESPSWKGIAQYKAKDYQGAIETLSQLDDPVSQYNLGNAYAQAGDLEAAQKTYESLLAKTPDNADAKHNLDVVKKALEQQKQQQQEQKDQQSNDQQQGEGDESQDKSQSQQGSQDQSSQDQQGDQQQQNPSKQEGSGQESSEQERSGQESADQQQEQSSEQSQPQSADANKQDGAEQQSEAKSEQEQTKEQDGQQNEQGQDGEQNQDGEQGEQPAAMASESGEPANDSDALTASNPVLKKLEQVQDDTAALLRAQLILQARQKEMPQPTENSW
ncbi:tetratricopeptide repeat protein, partial [Enterovibrio norvegicus]|uniref:tetratricopeptide repeat protein n=2 Tax=Enterovibrio TaxID=188143 RepID=UPI000362432C